LTDKYRRLADIVTGKCFYKKVCSKMEQIFDFQFSKEVYVRPSTVQANKGGEVTHFVIQI
jgi:hypothetical protein